MEINWIGEDRSQCLKGGMMRKSVIGLFLGTLLCVLVPTAAIAEESSTKEKGRGYVFVGFGAVNSYESIIHFGGGGEVALFKGFGVGVELGYLGPAQYFGDGIGVLSLNGQYDFRTGSSSKLRPFLTGGCTLAMNLPYVAGAVNFGGGVHYWFKDRIGLRLEFRDHVSPEVWHDHAWQGRVGFAFR